MTAHVSGLLSIVAVQLAVIFMDQQASWSAKLATALATLIPLVFADRTRQRNVTVLILGAVGVLTPVVTFALTKMQAGSMLATVGTGLVAVFVRLPALLSVPLEPETKGPVNMNKIASVLFLAIALSSTTACHGVKPDQFAGIVVDCAKQNPEASAALTQVEMCLLGMATQNYALCMNGLVTDAKFTVDEIVCVAAWLADQQNKKVAASTASLLDVKLRDNAAAWLAQEHIAIRNSYVGAR